MEAIDAVIAWSEFMRYSGVGTISLLEAPASAASQPGDMALQADALTSLGSVAYDRSDLDIAQPSYEEALLLYHRALEPCSIQALADEFEDN